MPTNAKYAVYQGKAKVTDNVRDLTTSISQTKADKVSGRKEQQEQRRKTIAERRAEMEQVKQKKQPASTTHTRPTTRQESHEKPTTGQEQFHERPTARQENFHNRETTVQASNRKSQQLKQERPTVKTDSSSSTVEHQNNTAQERTIQKPSITVTDRTSQRPVTKDRTTTIQRVPIKNTKTRPPLKTATIKKDGRKS